MPIKREAKPDQGLCRQPVDNLKTALKLYSVKKALALLASTISWARRTGKAGKDIWGNIMM